MFVLFYFLYLLLFSSISHFLFVNVQKFTYFPLTATRSYTAQKMKFSINGFFSKCDQIRRKLRIWSHSLKKSLMENLIFCEVLTSVYKRGVKCKMEWDIMWLAGRRIRNPVNILDGAFCKNNKRHSAVNCFCKMLHFR